MVGQIVMQSGLNVSRQTANFILAGIIFDSNRFLYSKDWKNAQANSRLFKTVSLLLEKGANLSWIYKNLYKTNVSFLRAVGYICDNFILTGKGIALIKITDDILKKYNADFKAALGSLRSYYNEVEEIKVWLLALEDKKSGIIRISLRSDQGIIINRVAEKYGGGGHKFAAGARLNNWKELNDVIDDLNREIEKQKAK